MKRILLLPFFLLYSFFAKTQSVQADLGLQSASIQTLAGGTVNANLLSLNQVVRYRIIIRNFGPGIAPAGHFKVSIGLGTGFDVNPGFNLATAPLSDKFNWTRDASSGQVEIIGTSIADLPASYGGTAIFEIKAVNPANSTISGNIFVSNPAGTTTPLSDPQSGNNFTANSYNIAQDLVLSTTQTNVNCFGSSNGSITATATGGYTPYTYTISPAAGTQANPGIFTNLPANTYTVTVTDASANSKNTQVTIIQPAALSVTSAGATPIACNGGTVTLTIAATGGTGTRTYTVNPGNLSNTTGTFSGLVAGSYSYSVTDANNCGPVTGNITITQPAAITGSGAVTSNYNGAQISCTAASDGVITVTATGGTGTLQSSLNNGTFQTGNVFSGLGAGGYSINIKDANGCTFNAGTITITAPAALTGSGSVTSNYNGAQISCNAATDGVITASGSGGTGALQYALNNGSFQTSAIFSGLAAGTYSLTVKDANGCTFNVQNISITAPPAITASANATTISCNGGTATVTVSGSGGTGTLAYTLNPGNFSNNTGVFNNLSAGTYNYSVTDVNNCPAATGTVVVGQPAAITVTATPTNAVCNGGNGSAALSATGGTGGPYTYTSNGGTVSGATLTAPAGTYTITATDGNTCSGSTQVTITQPAAISVGSTAKTDANCNGAATGTITLQGAGGTPPYNYTVTGAGSNTTGNFTGLAAGTYNYSITDAKNCTPATGSLTIGQPAAVTAATATSTNANCNGASTGSITLAGAGGTGAYAYSISGPVTNTSGATSGNFTGLPAGTYNYSITDANSCTAATGSLTVGQPAVLTASETHTNVSCFGGANGTATITATGGTAAYNYTLGTTTNNTGAFTGLAAGTYSVTIVDANSCTTTQGITITEPAALTSSIAAQTNVACFGGATGSVTVTGISGTPGYTYSINGTTFQNSGTFTSLTAGNYTVTVTDNNGCTTTQAVTITQPAAALVASITSQTNVDCFGNSTGSVTVAGANGTAGYTYSINGTTFQNSGTFGGLAAGAYTITVKDANGCTATQGVNITGPAAALTSSTTAQTNVACFGGATGSVTVAGANGTAGYTYSIDGNTFQNGGSFGGLAAGNYSITVKDANGCTTTQAVTITQPAIALSSSITSQTNVACFGGSTGSATVAGAGGTSPYSYMLGTISSTGTFTGLAAGGYSILVTDNKGCTTTQNVTITQPAAALSSSVTAQTNVACFGNTTGSVTVAGANGTSPYTYSTDGTTFQNSGIFNGLSAGNYTVTVKDNNGCTTTQPVIITGPTAALTGSIASQNNVACFGGSTGSVTVAGAGGTSPYSYILGATTNTSGTFTGLAAGSYSITITDNNNCTTTQAVTVTQPPVLSSSITSQTNVACFGGSTGSVTVAGTGGTSSYTYSKDGTNFQNSGTFNGLPAGSYTITVKDNNGCTTTQGVTITQPAAALSGSITAQTNVACFGNATGSVTVAGANGTAPYTYSINGTTFQNSGTFNGLSSGAYTITVKDNNNCTTTQAVSITQPAAALTSTITSQTNVACFSNSNGSVMVTGAGGTPSYNYTLGSITNTSGTFTGLAAGTYSITVTDANSCTTVQAVTITQPAAALVATETHTNADCFGNATGSATISATGGSGPYSGTGTFTGLAAGTYSYTVTDANGCTASVSVTISQAGTVTVSATATNVSCNGAADGTITATASTGATITINGQPYNATATYSPGTYIVVASVANGNNNGNCTASTTVTITQPIQVTINASKTNVSCNGAADGTITATASAGASITVNGQPYNATATYGPGTYTLVATAPNGNNNGSCTASATVTITQPIKVTITGSATNVSCFGANNGSLNGSASPGSTVRITNAANVDVTANNGAYGPGTYTATATAPNGNNNGTCSASITLTITQPIQVTISASKTNVSCNGAADGTITATASAGATITINGNTYNAIATYGPGTYNVVATAPNGNNNGSCTATTTVTITEPAAVAINATSTNVSCNGAADGTITATASAGATITINGQPYIATTTYGPGTYTVVATAPNGNNNGNCTATTTVTITQPAAVTISATATNVSCNGAADGTIIATASTGATITVNGQPYNAGATYGPGTYAITATASNGNNGSCTTSTTVNITQPIPVTVNATKTNVSCNGAANGTITASASSGATITVNSQPYNATATYGPGTYTVVATAPNGNNNGSCTATTSVVITEPILVTISVTATNVSCNGAADGTLTATASTGASITVNGQPYSANTTYGPGTYTVTATAPNGNSNGNCTASTTVTISQPAPVTITANAANVSCNGAANGTITATASTGATITVNGNAYSANATYGPGTYNVVATAANGNNNGNCTASTTVTITEPIAVTVSASSTNVTCNGAANGTITASASAGAAITVNGQPYNANAMYAPGTYTVVATAPNGNNNGNCMASTTVTITQPAASTSISLISKTNNICNGGTTGTINVSASGGSGTYTYTIIAGTTVNTTGASSGMFTGLAAGTYSITAADANGCTGTISGITITQPSATTPDGSLSVANFTSNFFPATGSQVTLLFQVTENAGNAVISALLRTTKQEDYTFSLLNQSSIIIRGTNYSLANANWIEDDTNPVFYDLNLKNGSQVNCGQSVYLAVRITRNTANKSNFTLTSVLQNINSETGLSNNATSFILVAQ